MSSDGVQTPTWYGSAFPHLLHGPGFVRGVDSQSYGDLRKKNNQGPAEPPANASDVHAHAGTGTWNGAAPKGAGARVIAERQAAEQAKAKLPVSEPRTTLVGAADMPMMGFSTDAVDGEEAVRNAISSGYRLVVSSPGSGKEAAVGKALASADRADLFVVSKLPNDCHRPDAVREACEKSVADLACGSLDLYLMEWPVAFVPGTQDIDDSVTLTETWAAMETLVDEGLVKAIGVANCGVKQVEEILSSCRIKPAANQVELHALLAQRKLVGVLFRKGVQCFASAPLAGDSWELMGTLEVSAIAKELGKSEAEVALKWNTQRGIPVVPQLQSGSDELIDLGSFFTWKLSNEQKARLDTLDKHQRFCLPSWFSFEDPEEGGAVKPSAVL